MLKYCPLGKAPLGRVKTEHSYQSVITAWGKTLNGCFERPSSIPLQKTPVIWHEQIKVRISFHCSIILLVFLSTL